MRVVVFFSGLHIFVLLFVFEFRIVGIVAAAASLCSCGFVCFLLLCSFVCFMFVFVF